SVLCCPLVAQGSGQSATFRINVTSRYPGMSQAFSLNYGPNGGSLAGVESRCHAACRLSVSPSAACDTFVGALDGLTAACEPPAGNHDEKGVDDTPTVARNPWRSGRTEFGAGMCPKSNLPRGATLDHGVYQKSGLPLES